MSLAVSTSLVRVCVYSFINVGGSCSSVGDYRLVFDMLLVLCVFFNERGLLSQRLCLGASGCCSLIGDSMSDLLLVWCVFFDECCFLGWRV